MEKNNLTQQEIELKNIEATYIDIGKLKPFKNHVFKMYDDERFEDMKTSIDKSGILTPIIVRTTETDGEFEILSGHNRVNAAKELGLVQIPAIIKQNITDDEALVYVIQTNLIQRSFADMVHSEKAAVLKLHHKNMFSKHKMAAIESESKLLEQSGRTNSDTAESQTGKGKRMNEKIGVEYGLAKNTVARYLRLSELIEPLLEKIDNDEIPFIAGVDLSFLKGKDQNLVYSAIDEHDCKITVKNAAELKEASRQGKLTEASIIKILQGMNKPANKKINVTLKHKTLQKYFSEDSSSKDIENEIIKSIEFTKNIIPETISKYLSNEELAEIEDFDEYVISIIEKNFEENKTS